jgi:predicted nucleotidyltransferase
MTIPHDLDLAGLADWAGANVPNALFWTVSGAHLYGFPSADSDVDLRGCFLAPIPELIGLKPPVETREPKGTFAGREVEAVAHEAGKYLRLLLRHNGYVLEQVFSPLVAAGAEFLARLRPLAARCVTRNCYHHYRGFLHTQRRLMDKEPAVKAKTLLYAYRVVLTGIHLLDTGEVVAHLPALNEWFRLRYVPELIERKRAAEFGPLTGIDVAFHRAELDRLERELDRAFAGSKLPEAGPFEEMDRFLVGLRLAAAAGRVTS